MIEKIQIIIKDFDESFEGMSYETIGRLLMGAFSFAKDEDPSKHIEGDSMAKTFLPMLKGHIQRNEEYRLRSINNGKKGGAPIGNTNAKKTTENNLNQPKTSKNNLKQPKNNLKQAPNLTLPNLTLPNQNKKLYGECQNVKLTEEEYNKIVEGGHKGLIDELSLYIASKGDKYKSHYATILQWAKNREKDKAVVIKDTPFNTGYMRREQESNEELEKKFIKNL